LVSILLKKLGLAFFAAAAGRAELTFIATLKAIVVAQVRQPNLPGRLIKYFNIEKLHPIQLNPKKWGNSLVIIKSSDVWEQAANSWKPCRIV